MARAASQPPWSQPRAGRGNGDWCAEAPKKQARIVAVLPSRSTLESWRPDALITSSADVEACGESVRTAVSSIDDACERLPEVRAWSGPAHDAAAEMFGRADVAARIDQRVPRAFDFA